MLSYERRETPTIWNHASKDSLVISSEIDLDIPHTSSVTTPGIALDRTATEAAIRSSRSSPQSQQREPQSPPRDIQHLGQQNQRFGRKAHTLCGKKCTRHDPNQSPAGQVDDMNPQIPHTPPESDIQAIVAKLRTPSKPQLQSICVVNGLPKTGNKADLSHRIEKRKLLLVFSTSSLFSPKPPPPTISARLPFSHVTMRTLPLLTLFHQ